MAKKVAAGPVEEPWALPDSWRWERLRSVGRWGSGGTPKAKTPEYYGGGLPWYKIGDLTDGVLRGSADTITQAGLDASSAKWVPSGSLLVAMYGSIGKLGLAIDPVTTNQAIAFCVPDGRTVTLWYLFYFLLFRRPHLLSLGQGGTQQNISQTILLEEPIALPPVNGQERIVARIDELFAEVDDGEAALARARDDLATWRKALLKAAVTGELTADWRAANPPTETGADLLTRILADRRAQWETQARNRGKRYREPEQPDLGLFKHLPALPSGWTWASTSQLTSFVTSGSRGWAEYYSDAGATFIRAQNINTDRLSLNGVAYVMPPKGGEGARTKVSKGDLLITITGANVTKSALVDVDLEEAYVSQHVGLVRPVDESLAAFLYWWVVTPTGGRAILERLAYGAGKPGLNLPNLLGLPVPLAPLEEQREITRICASVDEERSTCVEATREGQDAAATLRQSVLAAAFRGDLA